MDATTVQPTLLSAARNFMRKSAGKAALVIAPLAAVSLVNEAKAQTAIFGTAQTSGAFVSIASGAGYGFYSGFFSTALTPANGITGVNFGMNAGAFASSGFFAGNLNLNFSSVSATSSGSLPVGTSIPFNYDFVLTPSGANNVSWTLFVALYDQAEATANYTITGTNTGEVTGATFLTIDGGSNPNGLPNFNGYSATLSVYFESSTAGSVIVGMNPGQGLAFNEVAVPEPSTWTAILGLAALGFVGLRRARRCAA